MGRRDRSFDHRDGFGASAGAREGRVLEITMFLGVFKTGGAA
jgi:hypothetical protein